MTAVHAAATFLAAAAITALAWRAGPRLGLVALPNERSSHDRPTTTSGGIGFVVPIVVWLAAVARDYPSAVALAACGGAIAAVGLVDDARDLRRDVRLACYLALCAASVLWLFDLPPTVAFAAIVGLTAWVNLYNFMDGTDGLAASQAIAYALGALILGDLEESAPFAWILVAATAGFLCFNWAPAKVFMGDVGSLFLGLATGVTALWLWQNGELPFVASLILLVAFWLDASYTLLMRIATGQAFARAHRTHLYQIIAARLGHGATAGVFWLYTVAWLWPLAGVCITWPAWCYAALAAACLPVAVACVVCRAGVADAAGTADEP
ncbi:MAG: glycosyltransferase family 4 protein [Gammaproteobacteria bacterium]|nr:glycosyltransferase family 4 protein [Gammaproteobacteria bacterium]